MNKWEYIAIGDICEITGGNSAPQGTEPYDGGVMPFVRMRDLGRYHFTSHLDQTDDKLTEDAIKKYRMKVFEPGCILFPRSGSVFLNHRAILGTRACIVSHIGVMQNLKETVNVQFLYYFLQTFDMTRLSKKTTGVDSIAFSDVAKIKVPLPPLPEQERIVRLLNEVESLRATRKRANVRMEQFAPALFQEMFGDPVTNPKKWEVVEVRSLLKLCEYGTSQKANEEGIGLPVLRMGNVTFEGDLDLSNLKHVELSDNEAKKQLLENGDVLFNRTNSRELVGKTGMWDGRFPAYAASYFIRMRFDSEKEHPQHFTTFMNLPYMKKKLADMARGAVGQANINAQELQSIEMPVPPLALQREFAARVEEARGVQSAQGKSTERVEALYQSMLSRAFAGEL
jgi:type I restriction enzyme, S subunit